MKSIAMLVDNEFVMDKRVYRQAKTLSDSGFQLILYAVKRKDLPDNEIIDGIMLKRIFENKIFDIKKKKYQLQAAESIAQTNPDIIHCHDWIMLHIGRLVKNILPHVILIYDSHELFSSYPIHYSSGKFSILLKTWVVRKYEVWQEKKDVKEIDYLITVSQSIADYIEKRFRLKSKPILVRNFAEPEVVTEKRDFVREAFNISAETRIVVLFAFMIYKRKRNIETVVEQLANRKGIAFVIFCREEGHKKYFVDLVNERGIKNIFFHRVIDKNEIVNYLSSCDVGVIPTWNKKDLSYWMGLENKLFHYVMSGLPVLSSATPEHKRIIDEYKIGECADGDKPNDYFIKLEKILANYSFYKANVMDAKKYLSWETEKETLINFYKKISV